MNALVVPLAVAIIALLATLLIGPGPALVVALLVLCGCLTAAGLSHKD